MNSPYFLYPNAVWAGILGRKGRFQAHTAPLTQPWRLSRGSSDTLEYTERSHSQRPPSGREEVWVDLASVARTIRLSNLDGTPPLPRRSPCPAICSPSMARGRSSGYKGHRLAQVSTASLAGRVGQPAGQDPLSSRRPQAAVGTRRTVTGTDHSGGVWALAG